MEFDLVPVAEAAPRKRYTYWRSILNQVKFIPPGQALRVTLSDGSGKRKASYVRRKLAEQKVKATVTFDSNYLYIALNE